MDSIDICVVIEHFDLSAMNSLHKLNSHWYKSVIKKLEALAYRHNLPVFESFNQLYKSYFWCSNRLLQYARKNDDKRLEQIALERYAVDVEELPLINFLYPESISSFESNNDFSIRRIYEKAVSDKNYELAIHIARNYKMDCFVSEHFLNFCLERELHDVINKLYSNSEHVQLVMEQTDCTKEQATAAIITTKGDVVNAILSLVS
jgi:hypothetical protein